MSWVVAIMGKSIKELETALCRLGNGSKWVDIDAVLSYMGITLWDLLDLVAQDKGRFELDYSDEVVKRLGFADWVRQ